MAIGYGQSYPRMSVRDLPYRPCGSWWRRLRDAITLAVVNVRLRSTEGTDEFDLIERVELLERTE